MFRTLALAILGLLLPGVAGAADGVREINAACVIDGCFSGDAPGFPVTIGSSGSYLLTSNLRTVGILGHGQNFPFIEITASDVTLDLGGFTLSCRTPSIPPFPCSGSQVSGGDGIIGTGTNVTVRNGTVRDMADDGVQLGSGAVVEDVRVIDNADLGIVTGNDAAVRRCTARDNGGIGILAGAGANVSGNISNENGEDGFAVSIGSTVIGNTANGNEGDGFDLGFLDGGSSLSGGLVANNNAHSNDGFGLRLETVWGYTHNVLTNNNGGNANPQVSFGIDLGQNVCGSNSACP